MPQKHVISLATNCCCALRMGRLTILKITVRSLKLLTSPLVEARKKWFLEKNESKKKARYTIINHRSSFLTCSSRIAVAPLKKMKADNCPLRNLQIGRLLEGHWMGAQGFGLVPMLSSPF